MALRIQKTKENKKVFSGFADLKNFIEQSKKENEQPVQMVAVNDYCILEDVRNEKTETVYRASFSNESSLTSEERKSVNMAFREEAIEQLKLEGFDFSQADENYNICRNVIYQGKLYAMTFRSVSSDILELKPYEFQAMKDFKGNFFVVIKHKHCMKKLRIEEILKSQDAITLKVPLKDSSTEAFEQMLDTFGGIKDVSFAFSLKALNSRPLESSIDIDLDTYDRTYVNTVTNDDDEI